MRGMSLVSLVVLRCCACCRGCCCCCCCAEGATCTVGMPPWAAVLVRVKRLAQQARKLTSNEPPRTVLARAAKLGVAGTSRSACREMQGRWISNGGSGGSQGGSGGSQPWQPARTSWVGLNGRRYARITTASSRAHGSSLRRGERRDPQVDGPAAHQTGSVKGCMSEGTLQGLVQAAGSPSQAGLPPPPSGGSRRGLGLLLLSMEVVGTLLEDRLLQVKQRLLWVPSPPG